MMVKANLSSQLLYLFKMHDVWLARGATSYADDISIIVSDEGLFPYVLNAIK